MSEVGWDAHLDNIHSFDDMRQFVDAVKSGKSEGKQSVEIRNERINIDGLDVSKLIEKNDSLRNDGVLKIRQGETGLKGRIKNLVRTEKEVQREVDLFCNIHKDVKTLIQKLDTKPEEIPSKKELAIKEPAPQPIQDVERLSVEILSSPVAEVVKPLSERKIVPLEVRPAVDVSSDEAILKAYSLSLKDGVLYRGETKLDVPPRLFFESVRTAAVAEKNLGQMIIYKDDGEEERTPRVFLMEKKLGEGSFGEVLEAKELGAVDETPSIVKRSKVLESAAKTQKAENDVAHEVTLLIDIHKDVQHPGIQPPPHKVVHFATGQVGYIGVRFEGDIYDNKAIKQLSPEERIHHARTLLDALSFMHNTKKVKHGDIKEENMLMRKLPDGKLQIVFADFGGARKFENDGVPDKAVLKELGAFSPHTCFSELQIPINNDYEASESLPTMSTKEQIQLLTARDVFCLGLIFRDTLLSKEALAKLPQEKRDALKGLIGEMLEHEYTERITAEQALAWLNEIFPPPQEAALLSVAA